MYSRLLMIWLLLIVFVAPTQRALASEHPACIFSDAEAGAMQSAFERLANAGLLSTPPPDVLWDPPANALSATYTRAEFAVIVVRGLGLLHEVEGAASGNPFLDMSDHWAVGYVTVLYRLGIVEGYGDGQFHPDERVTLIQVKLMIARTLRLGTDLSMHTVDDALLRGGVEPTVTCPDDEVAQRGQVFLLLDRAWSRRLERTPAP